MRTTVLVILSMVVGCGIALHYLLNMTRAVPCFVRLNAELRFAYCWPSVPITGFPRQRPSIRLQP